MKSYILSVIAGTALLGLNPVVAEHPKVERPKAEAVCTGKADCSMCQAKKADSDKQAVCTGEPDCPVCQAKKGEAAPRRWWQFWRR